MRTPAERGRSRASDVPAAAFLLAILFPALVTALSIDSARAQEGQPVAFSGPGVSARDTLPGAPRQTPAVERREKKSSLTAVALSAILPGAGQVYTEQYWKVPLILGLGGYWVYEWTRNNDRYREFRDLYSASILTTPPQGDGRYLSLREFYKDQRDSFTWYIGLLYLLNIVDAYVGAELYDFDVGPDLGRARTGVYASVKIRF